MEEKILTDDEKRQRREDRKKRRKYRLLILLLLLLGTGTANEASAKSRFQSSGQTTSYTKNVVSLKVSLIC